MKKLLIISSIICYNLFAQDESQSQSIELPDFVITGQESISIPKVQKNMSAFIPLLSQDFFTPEFPKDEKTTIELPDVNTEIINLSKSKQLTKARLRFSAGLETWPSGDFFYNDWTGNFSYDLNILGSNELEYVKNAGISMAGASIGSKYFVDHESRFLPGLEISFRGSYYYESFNFYGSSNPSLERTVDNGLFDIGLNYITDLQNSFGFGLSDAYFNKRDVELDENIIGLRAYYMLKFGDLNLRLDGNYSNQVISSTLYSIPNQVYFRLNASADFLFYDIINIKTGLYYSEKEGNSFFMPNVFASIKLDQNFSVYGSFSPNTEFKTLQDFYRTNIYYNNNAIVNTQIENKVELKFAFKYEYEKYFEISGGAGYINSDNNFYFEDDTKAGIFSLNIIDTEKSYLFLNFLFRKGPFGQFYSNINLQNISAGNSKQLPYQSDLLANFIYSYDWESGYGIKIGLIYFSESFTDLDNTNTIPEEINLNLLLYYEIFKNFDVRLEFENLLDNDYYYFRNYNAKPFDLLAGFEFRW